MQNTELFEKLPAEKQTAVLQAGIREFAAYTYREANTDRITAACGISKGLLFHYFGSKGNFYLYCLERTLNALTEPVHEAAGSDFYEVLFDFMDQKMQLCREHPVETGFVNMAARESAKEIAESKNALIGRYTLQVHARSGRILSQAAGLLGITGEQEAYVTEGLFLYVSAIMNKYLKQYQNTPMEFFERAEEIKAEFKRYVDLMLYGISEKKIVD